MLFQLFYVPYGRRFVKQIYHQGIVSAVRLDFKQVQRYENGKNKLNVENIRVQVATLDSHFEALCKPARITLYPVSLKKPHL